MDTELIKHIATILITIVISMTGFWMMIGRDFVTRVEAAQIVDEKTKPLQLLFETSQRRNEETAAVLRELTSVTVQLKVEIAKLNETIRYLEQRVNDDRTKVQ